VPRTLAAASANAGVRAKTDFSALDLAKKYGHSEMLTLCISRRAKVCRTLGSRVHLSEGDLMSRQNH
jgi:hypothetical protein